MCFLSWNFREPERLLLLYHKNKYLSKPLSSSIHIIQQIYKEHKCDDGQNSGGKIKSSFLYSGIINYTISEDRFFSFCRDIHFLPFIIN